MILGIDWMQYAIYFLYASLMAIVVIIGYRYMIRRWSKQVWKKEDFVQLFSLENSLVSGEISFFFEVFSAKHVRFVLVDQTGKEVKSMVDEVRKPGGYVIRVDTTQIPNGIYYYCLTAENQRTEKRLEVNN